MRRFSIPAFAILLLNPGGLSGIDRPPQPRPASEVTVTLVGRAENLGAETVNFGLPLPPGFLSDANLVRILGVGGAEIEAAVRPLEPWRLDGKDGTIRSMQIQFQADFRTGQKQQVIVAFGKPRRKSASRFVPVRETLIEPEGLEGPRVLALVPAKWLCDSWVAGPQVPAADSGPYSFYDRLVEKNFPGSLEYIDSRQFDHWLFDRTTCWYKMYVRTGDRKYVEAAYRAAHFVRTHTVAEGKNAGAFIPKGSPDLKYVYPRAMHIHYLLTGDERAQALGKVMGRLILDNWNPIYRGGFWTPRHQGYGFLGVLHGWELTGDPVYWNKAKDYADALWRHQQQPPDGRPPDGSLRQNWGQYDSSEAGFKGATSAWMMAILLDPMFHYWTLTGDPRIPEMVVKWCDFLDRKGLKPDGRSAYYVINCFAGEPGEKPSTPGGDMTRHNTEMAYQFAMGVYFSRDPARREVYRKRLQTLFEAVQDKDLNQPARAFNWAFQASSQLVYFLQQPGATAGLAGQVRSAEMAFAKTMADRDHAAFVSFLDEEAIFVSSNRVLRGANEVAAGWKRFFEGPQAPFSWEPEQVQVLDSGALALSSGPVRDHSGKRIGTFNSIWRRETGGAWKIVIDNGCPPCDGTAR